MLLIITLHAHQSHQTPNTSVVVGADKGYVNQKHSSDSVTYFVTFFVFTCY